MRHMYAMIRRRRREFARLPLFDFLREESIDPDVRLRIAPSLAHFVMSFSDLNKHIFRDLSRDDRYQHMVNLHSYEDENHWLWYLEDLAILGLDKPQGLIESMRFLWGDHAAQSRILTYRICQLANTSDPLVKLGIIEAIECTGNVFFRAMAPIARAYEEATGRKLRFFSHRHLRHESGHVVNDEEISIELESLILTSEQRTMVLHAVQETFDAFHQFIDEVYDYSLRVREAVLEDNPTTPLDINVAEEYRYTGTVKCE